MNTPQSQVYEIPNTYTRDLPLDEQIALGINDWRAEFGRQIAFGHSREEAIANLSAEEPGDDDLLKQLE